MVKNAIFAITLAALGLTACAQNPNVSKLFPPVEQKLSKDKEFRQERWLTFNCQTKWTDHEATLSTNGIVSGGTLRFKLNFPVFLKKMPRITITTLGNFEPNIEGRNGIYSFEVPYEYAYQIRPFLKPHAAFVLTYEPLHEPYEYHAAFPAQGLAEEIQKLQNKCQ